MQTASTVHSPAGDDLAVPVDMSARRGAGLELGVSLGGGGAFFVAWQITYLHELARRGVDLAGSDRVVGTSAGSVVATVLEAGSLPRLWTELRGLARLPKLLGALAPTGELRPSQERALDLFRGAADSDPQTIREIGRAALAAQTPRVSVMPRNLSVLLGRRSWPSPRLHITCVDTYTGERCVAVPSSGVSLTRAVAASSAVPGLFAPQPVGDRHCMDGGVSGSGLHTDLLAGARRVVVLALTDGAGVTEGRMTMAPGTIEAELDALRDSGSEVLIRMPETIDLETLMDPAAIPDAITMARRQASADAEELRAFLA